MLNRGNVTINKKHLKWILQYGIYRWFDNVKTVLDVYSWHIYTILRLKQQGWWLMELKCIEVGKNEAVGCVVAHLKWALFCVYLFHSQLSTRRSCTNGLFEQFLIKLFVLSGNRLSGSLLKLPSRSELLTELNNTKW